MSDTQRCKQGEHLQTLGFSRTKLPVTNPGSLEVEQLGRLEDTGN